jgi:regulator of sigma D
MDGLCVEYMNENKEMRDKMCKLLVKYISESDYKSYGTYLAFSFRDITGMKCYSDDKIVIPECILRDEF